VAPRILAAHACRPTGHDGLRAWPEAPSGLRNPFQRDRDRIIHSAAFRRLEYKTQVFVNHEGDMFRTRLTHTIEVAQVARTLARALAVDEDLTEAICLGHDLGHAPFGHAGQDALNRCLADLGGFEHNLQSLRVVDLLEDRYADFPGLNLTFATREGILKHCSARQARRMGELGRRFLSGRQPGLEAQLANVGDAIAYTTHDVDDGLRSGLLALEELEEVELVAQSLRQVRARWPGLSGRKVSHEVVRHLMGAQIEDLLEASCLRLRKRRPAGAEDVRASPAPLVEFSVAMRAMHLELKRYLRRSLYEHPRVQESVRHARRVVTELFRAYRDDDSLLPAASRQAIADGPPPPHDTDPAPEHWRTRVVADHIAGMTDRFALAEHRRIYPEGDHAASP
jgi:dGTPase